MKVSVKVSIEAMIRALRVALLDSEQTARETFGDKSRSSKKERRDVDGS